jgi:putative transposase
MRSWTLVMRWSSARTSRSRSAASCRRADQRHSFSTGGVADRVAAAKRLDVEFGTKWPKAAAKVGDDLDKLLTVYDFPAEHWLQLKTSNPIESTFATVRLRTRVTKGPGSQAAGLEMAFKLIQAARERWRAVNGPHLVALVHAGAAFHRGLLVEGSEAAA